MNFEFMFFRHNMIYVTYKTHHLVGLRVRVQMGRSSFFMCKLNNEDLVKWKTWFGGVSINLDLIVLSLWFYIIVFLLLSMIINISRVVVVVRVYLLFLWMSNTQKNCPTLDPMLILLLWVLVCVWSSAKHVPIRVSSENEDLLPQTAKLNFPFS